MTKSVANIAVICTALALSGCDTGQTSSGTHNLFVTSKIGYDNNPGLIEVDVASGSVSYCHGQCQKIGNIEGAPTPYDSIQIFNAESKSVLISDKLSGKTYHCSIDGTPHCDKFGVSG